MISCQGCGQSVKQQLLCPNCHKLGRNSYFCSQECFKNSWGLHHRVHKIIEESETYKDFLCLQKNAESTDNFIPLEEAHQDLPNIEASMETCSNLNGPCTLPDNKVASSILTKERRRSHVLANSKYKIADMSKFMTELNREHVELAPYQLKKSYSFYQYDSPHFDQTHRYEPIFTLSQSKVNSAWGQKARQNQQLTTRYIQQFKSYFLTLNFRNLLILLTICVVVTILTINFYKFKSSQTSSTFFRLQLTSNAKYQDTHLTRAPPMQAGVDNLEDEKHSKNHDGILFQKILLDIPADSGTRDQQHNFSSKHNENFIGQIHMIQNERNITSAVKASANDQTVALHLIDRLSEKVHPKIHKIDHTIRLIEKLGTQGTSNPGNVFASTVLRSDLFETSTGQEVLPKALVVDKTHPANDTYLSPKIHAIHHSQYNTLNQASNTSQSITEHFDVLKESIPAVGLVKFKKAHDSGNTTHDIHAIAQA